ncbi:MAG TPA: class I SAM-dependent methyltransferase [Candidatus Stackebrandtia excrementipullorum]|nr:class I SAM-dependent methyltransferase [Candidatus Stackebrandtia excrementipullorum]
MTDNTQTRVTGYWNRYAREYDANQLERQQHSEVVAAWSRVWDAALPDAPSTVLDVGTGSGNVALLLADMGYRVTGVDLAENMLAEARRKSGDNAPVFTLADATSPPFEDASFDAITARYALWTLKDPVTAFRRWIALLRPGGILVAVDALWFPEGISDAEPTTDRQADFQKAYSESVLHDMPLAQSIDIHDTARLLKQAGFVDVVVDELPELLQLDHRYGVAPGHQPRMQYRITARVGDIV